MTNTRRALLAGLLVFVGVLALLYTVDVAMARGKVPRGTVVNGVHIGGKTKAEARRLLARLDAPHTVVVTLPDSGDTLSVQSSSVGLRIDPDRTVEHARAESLNPWGRLRAVFGKHEVAPVATANSTELRAALKAWAKKVDRVAREASITFDGTTPVGVPPRAGRVVDVDATAGAIVDAYPGDLSVEGVAAVDPVKTSDADLARALDEIARPAVSAPVTLTTPNDGVTMTRAMIAKVLRIDTNAEGKLAPRLDTKTLNDVLLDVLKPVEHLPKDAGFKLGPGDTITVTPSALGRKVDRDALAVALLPALTQPAPRTVPLSLVTAEPRITTARAKALGVKEKVGEFTTYHPCCRPRVQNIHTIANIVNGAVVLPGETFSLNGYVGERDRGRGFVEAPMILDGKFVPAVGGGVSQFATTMFNAVFFGGFADVYHKPHSYYISRYPAGREATVSSPTPDLKWRNDSSYGVFITTSYTGKSVTVTFWSTKRYDIESVSGPRYRIRSTHTEYDSSPTCESSSGEPGFDIDVWRVFKVAGKEVRREKFHTRYFPEPRFVCT